MSTNLKKIRVLFVLQSLGVGGIQNVILNYLRQMYDVVDADFVVFTSQITDALYLEELKQHGCNIYPVISFTSNMIQYQHDISKLLKEKHYDIIHDSNKYFAFLTLSAAKQAAIPIRICHVHNIITPHEKGLLHRLFISLASKMSIYFATTLLACSAEAGKSMFGQHTYTILNNAIEVSKYIFNPSLREKVRTELNLKGQFVVMMVARFDPLKRHDFAFEVFNHLYKRKENAVLVLVGMTRAECTGDAERAFEQMDPSALERVIFLGQRGDANILLNGADAFLLTSEHEGFGISVIEAQANGLSCFISDAIPSAVKVTDLVTFLPAVTDPAKWASCIETANSVLSRTAYSQQMENTEYSIQNSVFKLRKIYRIKD